MRGPSTSNLHARAALRRAALLPVLLLALLLPVAAGAAPATPVAADPAKPSSTAGEPATTLRAAARAPRHVARRIECAATVVPSLRRLTKLQRAQLRWFGAYRTAGRSAARGRKAMKSRWICRRSPRQATVVRSLTRDLGPAVPGDRTSGAVTLPARLDTPLRITLPEGRSAGWTMLDAPKVPAQTFQRGALYSTSEYDVVQEVGFGTLKESIAVHQRQGVRSWSWKLRWSGGIDPYVAEDGNVRYGANVILRRPFVQDVRGRKLRDLDWQLEGDVLSIRLDDRRLPLPYVIDPASNYPQRLYPLPETTTGSTFINDLNGTLSAGAANENSRVCARATGTYMVSSNNSHQTFTPMCTNHAPLTNASNGGAPWSAYGSGVHGWGQDALGGVTLAPGPYVAQVRTQFNHGGGGAFNDATAALRARMWKVVYTADGSSIQSSLPVTGWSPAGPPQTFTANGQYQNLQTTLTPVDRVISPNEHLYVEYAYEITNAGSNNSATLLDFTMRHVDTYIEFGGPATNTPGAAANLRLSSPPVNGTGWTTDNTPSLRANLDDPDWWHHLRYQVCTNATCGAVVQTGTTAASQMIGSTNDAWTVPTALTDGVYYMRARTEEDGGDAQIGPWNDYTATTCTAVDVGPCGRFSVDATPPTGTITNPTGTWNRGTVTVNGSYSDPIGSGGTIASGVGSGQVEWIRTSPTAAGPSAAGVTCGVTSCSWNTAAAGDGTYSLRLTLTDVAGNTYTTTTGPYYVDNTVPAWPGGSQSDDGPGPGDIQWTTNLTTLASNWTAVTETNLLRYEYCLSTVTSCGGTPIVGWTANGTALSQSSTGLALTDNTTYYSCVRAIDQAGNVSAVRCSNGQTTDLTPPSAPTTVNDGPGADIAWNASANTLRANWSGGGDGTGSGINRWEYCISTTSGAAGCTGTILQAWQTNGLGTSINQSPLPLVDGQQYVVCVRAFDNAGWQSTTVTCSNGQRSDQQAPPAPTNVADGAGADIQSQNGTTTIVANWPGVVDPAPGVGVASGLQRYEYCVTTSSSGADCAGAANVPWTSVPGLTSTTVTRSGLALVDGTTYFSCIRSFDVAGNQSGAIRCSDGVTIDGVAPVWPGGATSRDGVGPGDVQWTTSLTVLSSNWSAATDAQGIQRYEFCLSTVTDCGGTPIVGWTTNATALTQTTGSLALAEGATYFSCVRAYDPAGNVSTALCSNGQRVDTIPPLLPPVVSDGTGADITWLQSLTTASANWPGGSDATSGIASWEYCISLGVGCTSTIAKTWTSNGTSTTQTSAGLTLVEGQLYYTCVRGTDLAGNATAGFACSNGQRVDTVAPPAPATVDDGTGADIQWSSSGSQLEASWTPVVDPAPPTGLESGLQAYQYCITTTASGTDCGLGTATVPWTTMSPPTGTSITRTGLSLTNGATYHVCVRSGDIAGNPGAMTCSNGNTIDLGPPTASFTRWTVTPTDPTRPHLWAPAAGNLLWYNPTTGAGLGGTATAVVTATDPGAGMNRVEFPDLAAGAAWGPGGIDATVGASDTWSHDYSFTGGGAIGDPALANATAYDNGGASTGSPALDFDIRPDGAAPVVGSMPALGGGLQNTTLWNGPAIPLGNDGLSGIARWIMDVRFAPLVDGTCGAWDPWVDGSSIPGYSGSASNGSTLSNSHWLNDPDFDGTPNYRDAFCFQMQVRVFDQVSNVATIPANGFMRFDFGPPDVAITGPADGTAQSGTFAITGTTDDVWTATDPFEYPDTGSGIDRVTVTYERVGFPATNGNACAPITAFGGTVASQTWSCSWATGSLPDGDYTVRVQARDRAGNLSTIATRTYRLDNNAPIVAWHSWNDGGSPWMHAAGNVAWVNPTAPGGAYQLDARVTATDAGSGVNRVEFPGLGAGWTPAAGFTNATFTSPLPVANAYTMPYTFANPSAIAAPGAQSARAFDGAGNQAPIGFEVRLDGTAPTGVTASVVDGRQSSAIVAVTVDGGTDVVPGSGVASWVLAYDTAPLADDSCGAWSNTWGPVTTGGGVAGGTVDHDVTALGSACYRYRLDSIDNVGNVGQSTPLTARRVDLVDPTVAITAPADASSLGGSFTVSGTATDAHTGIDRVALTWDRTSPTVASGTICDPATLGGSSPSWTFGCSWDTTPLPDGTYVVTARSYDRSGRVSSTSTITLFLDNNPPFVAFHSFVETSPYTHWAGPVGTNDQLWYNPTAPAGSHSFDVRFDVSDPSGVSGVEYPGAGAGWTPGGASSTQTVPVGPATRWSQSYAFDTSGVVAAPPVLTVTGRDVANNPATDTFRLTPDLAAPTGGTVTAPNGFYGSTSLDVTINTGSDADSGIASWRLLRSDGTLSGASCVAWSAYSTIVATGTGTATGPQPDTVSDPGCFRWRLEVTDNVGRVATFDGADETMIDLTPPTGAIVLAEGANPQYQQLASPTRIYVNTTAAGSGDFTASVNATAASGVLDVTFPALAAGFTGAGTMAGPGPSFVRTYSWTGPAGSPGAGLAAAVRSNSLGSLSLPFEVLADTTGPASAAPSHASGFTTATTTDVTFTAATDAGSGVASHQLQQELGSLAGGSCTWSGTWTDVAAATTPGTVAVPIAHASCVRFRTRALDNVANAGTSPASTPIMVDATAPTGATIDLNPATNPGRQYKAANDDLWVAADPGGAASFTATVTATDPESGTGAAVFPALGSTFVLTSTGTFTATYTFSATAVTPVVAPIVQVANGSGLTTTIPFTISVDGAAPGGATLDQENGYVTDYLVDVSFAGGGDGAGSGLASWRLERQSAPYAIATDTCSPWSTWATHPLPGGQPASPWVDTSVAVPTCYRYRLVEFDRVGNRTDTLDPAGDIAKVIDDITPPTPFSLTLPTNPALPAITTGVAAPSCAAAPTYPTSTPTFAWTASSDAESGLSHYTVHVDGPTVTATVPAPGTNWTSGALADGPRTVGVRALDLLANFRNADPAFPTTIRIDTAPPSGTQAAPGAGSWTADTTPTFSWTASDANCVARVEVLVDGAVVAVASGSETSWTPAAPLGNGSHDWSIRVIDTMNAATTVGPVTFGIDTAPPTPATITAPTVGQTVRGFVDVAWTASTDAGSGLAPASAYRVLIDGVVRATVPAGTTTATISGITDGPRSVVIRSTDAVGNTIDSAAVSFTGFGAIPVPVLVSPANGAFLNAVPTLQWSWPSDGGPSPTTYDVVVDGSVVGTEAHPTMTHAIADPGNGTHDWRISQTDPYTGVVTSLTRSFTIDRTAPTNPGPLTRAATVVSWPAPTDPAAPVASGIDRQEFWIDDGTTQTSTTLSAGSTSRNYGALPDGTYTMWVRAFDRAGNATNSPSIVVVNDSQPPTPFTLTPPAALPALPAIDTGATGVPACEAVPTFTTATPTLQWSASTDATSGLAGYDVFVDGVLHGSVGPAATSYVVAPALGGGAHSWHVVARDNFGLSRASTPNPMDVRIDGATPTAALSAPADNAFTADTTPTFSWNAGDDNCVARIELIVGGATYVLTGSAGSFTPATVLPEGPTTWSVRVHDSAGNVTTSATRTINVDTTPPTGVTAIFPTNAGSAPEQMMTFQWSAGSDGTGSGVTRYDLVVDGAPVASNLTTTSRGTFAIYAGAHTWSIRVYDAVGNSAVFPFTFTATPVPDVTPPDPFNLLTPADNAPVPAGTALTWEAAWDFKGVTQYRIFIDGNLAGTTAGNVTTFTPAAGAGAPICTVDFDPATSAGCIAAPTYSWGTGATTTQQNQAASIHMDSASYAGWSAGGNALGVGDPTVTPITNVAAGFDGSKAWTAVTYPMTVPAAGADLRFEHRYRTHTRNESAYDGATVELMVDKDGGGFANDVWESTCEFEAKQTYGTTLDCKYEIVDLAGGYTAVMGGSSKADHPLSGQHSFAGDSGGMVQTRMRLAEFAGKDILVRFRIGTDACYSGMPSPGWCTDPDIGAPGYHPVQWRIDNIALADPALLPGPHTWRVEARDAAGNARWSNQTWTFDLQP